MSDEGEESPARPRRRIKRVMVVSSASSSESEDSGPTTSTRRRRLRVLSEAGSDTSSGSSVVCGARRRRGALPQLRDSDGDSDTSGWATDHSDAPKPESKSCQGAPKPSSGFASDSSEGNSDKCSICLMRFTEQQVGTPATCEHIFCLDCIKEWSKNVNTCPVDRISFDSIVVRTCVGGRVLRNEPVKVVERPSSVDMMFVEDPTVCEICGSSSSEETMLLCDGCDLGYHMECLTPPLTEVPVDQWLCPNCDGLFDVIHLSEVNDLFSEIGDVDLDSLGPRPSALRAERPVRRSQRRQPPANQPSTSSGRRGSGPATDRLAATRSAPRRRPAATTHRTHGRKHKRRRTKTVIIEYEVQEKGKFAVTKTIKRRVKKRKTRTRRARTAARRTQVRASVRAQLASLRARGGLVHGRSAELAGAGAAALPTLSLFGSRDQLEYFSDEDQSSPGVDAGPTAGAGAGVALATRPTPAVFSAYRQARRKMLRVPSPSPASVAPDLVSSILESQTLLHSRRAVASVAPGGALRIELRPSPAPREVRSTDPVPGRASTPRDRLDLTGHGEGTRQAPAYPGGGRSGGGGWGGGYRGTYHREQTANSYARGGYGGYPPPRQPSPLYRRNGGHPDDFEGGGYGPPRRGPPFLPGDAPYERRRSDAGRGRAPWVPRPEHPARHSFGGFESSPGPSPGPGPGPAPPSYPPLREPPSFHFAKPSDVGEGNGGADGCVGGGDKSEDERSDPDLVIDTEKYDPTEPTNDDDDISPDIEEHPPTIVDASYASPEASCEEPVSAPLPPPPLPPTASMLDSAVRAVLEEHRLLAPAAAASGEPSDDDDGEEDGDCPNFSIYSATSVHIASTAATYEEPRDLNSERVTRRCPITVSPRNPIKIKLNAPSLIKRHVSLYDEEDALPEEVAPAPAPAPPTSDDKTHVVEEEPPPAQPPTPPTPPTPTPTPADRDDDNDDGKQEEDNEEEKERRADDEEELVEEKEREPSRSRSPSVGSSPAPEKMTESISEETEDERSYTPCLDENTGLEGLDTELISEDEAPGFSAVDEEPPSLEPEPEPGVTPPHGTVAPANAAAAGDEDPQPLKKKRKKERGVRGEGRRKPKRELTFKKIGKSGKERTYRERDKKRDRRESSESRVSRRRRDKRKDLERYDVRTVVGDKRRRVKDAFGRDVSPPRGAAAGAAPSSPARAGSSPSPRRRPTVSPRKRSSISPRRRPSLSPRRRPSMSPRRRPSMSPRRRPSMSPRRRPSISPRRRTSISPRRRPSISPRRRPSVSPRRRPSMSPRRRLSISPRRRPSISPRKRPSMSPRRRISISPRRRVSGSPAPASAARRRLSVSPARSGAGSPLRRSPSPRRRRRLVDGAPSRPKRRRVSGTRARKRRRSVSPEPSPKPKAKKKKRARSEQRRRTPRRRRRVLGGSGAGSPPPPPHGWAERPPSPRTPPAAPPPPAPRRLDRLKHRRARDSTGPSKEVFTSGDNILVSVSFKDQEESAARRERRRERRRRRRAAVESELAAVKPVAIIDLERSPFRELTPSPKNVIVLSDDEGRDAPPCGPPLGPHAAPVAASPQGPKTPPSPRVATDPAPAAGAARPPSPAVAAGGPGRGPNTPPSPPDSPDAYDPYEPTRSRSGSRSPRGGRDPAGPSPPAPPPAPGERPSMTLEAAQKTNLSADEVLDRRPLEPMEKVLALLASTRDVSPDPPPPSRGSDPPLGPPPAPLDAPALGPPAQQPPKLFLAKPSPIKSDPIKPMQQATKISRLPLPLPTVPLADADSPYSPGSSDFGELFEPPAPPSPPPAAAPPALAPRDAFDVLFDKPRNRKRPSAKVTPKPKPSKKGKAVVDVRLDDDSLKVMEELPSSAVEMQVKSKFLKKLNRQERVVEEVKLVLKPHYNKKHVTKDEYKHILRRTVPKICHNKTGEINPTKIQALVEAYVKKFRKKRKLGLP